LLDASPRRLAASSSYQGDGEKKQTRKGNCQKIFGESIRSKSEWAIFLKRNPCAGIEGGKGRTPRGTPIAAVQASQLVVLQPEVKSHREKRVWTKDRKGETK